jgi:hypothetical protein
MVIFNSYVKLPEGNVSEMLGKGSEKSIELLGWDKFT